MKLVDLLSKDRVVIPLESREKDGVLKELVAACAESLGIAEVDGLLRKVREREEIKTTGVGKGVALPHAIWDGVDGVKLTLGVAPEGLDFDAFDADLVYLVFLIVTEGMTTSYLTVLERVAKLFLDEPAWRQLLQAGSAAEVLNLLDEIDTN